MRIFDKLSLLDRLWLQIGRRRQRQFFLLLPLMIVASLAEVLSISAVLPFLGALTAPSTVFKLKSLQPVIEIFGLTSPDQLLWPLTAAFCLTALLAGAARILLLHASTKFCFAIGEDLSIHAYSRTLSQPYSVHISRSSNVVINSASIKINEVIFYVLMPLLTLISASVMLIAVGTALLFFTPAVALIAFGCLGSIYAIAIKTLRHRLTKNSRNIATESTTAIKLLQEGLGGIRDVIIDGTQKMFCDMYANSNVILRRAQSDNHFISQSPRFGVETAGMIIIALLSYFLSMQPDGAAKAIPTVAALTLGMQRLLPALQQVYASWSSVQGARTSLEDALIFLEQPLPDYAYLPEKEEPLPFDSDIKLEGISFRYKELSPWVLKNIELTIKKGSRIGFIGATGSGKSTLLDIVMGLLQPSKGILRIDGEPITAKNVRGWRAHIAHVPQGVFLTDSGIDENIAFGVPKNQIDYARVRRAANQAQIGMFIDTLPKGYETRVGERGVQLSGGQRQRIGIARALYKKADVIVFDEATSALDTETEEAVMEAIEALSSDLTILIIAHRLSTLRNCSSVIKLGSGEIIE